MARAGELPSPSRAGADAPMTQRYRAGLPPGRLREFPLDPYDRTGVPVWATVWTDAADPSDDAHGVGYGVTREQSVVGALGELAERTVMVPAVRSLTPRTASFQELVAERGADRVADPRTLVLPAGCDWSPERPLRWLPTRRWRTGEEVLVPAEFVASDPGSLPADPPPGGWLTTAITNGLGAGDTAERAVGHALLELVQRDGDTVSFRALDQGVVIGVDATRDPATRELLDRFTSLGIEVVVKLASTEFACVVYCVGRDTDPASPALAVSAVGEAAHPDRDIAVRKAVLEYASSRARRAFAFGPLADMCRHDPGYLTEELSRPLPPDEPRALEQMAAWTRLDPAALAKVLEPTLFARTRTVALASLPRADESVYADPDALLATMLDRLAAFDVLVLPGVSAEGSVHAAKVIAPGLEVETLSYLRVGERVLRRLLDRGSPLVGLGPPDTADRLPVRMTPEATERIGAPAWLDRAEAERVVGALYPLYREPRRHAVQRAAEIG